MRKVKVWRLKLIGFFLLMLSVFGFNFDPLQGSDCGIGLILLAVAGVWMLVGDPRKVDKVLK